MFKYSDLYAGILKDSEICRNGSAPDETIETAGCTGGCEFFKDGLPNCERCSSMLNK